MSNPVNISEWRIQAKNRLPKFVFDFIDGAAEDSITLKNNREAFEKISILPRVLRDTSTVDTCRIPDDCIDSKRYPLFMARAVLKELIESLQSIQGVKPC